MAGAGVHWTPAMVPASCETRNRTIKWAVQSNGKFEYMFVLTGGVSKLAIKNVKILFGDTIVASDDHEAMADDGVAQIWELKMYELYQSDEATLQADIQGLDGTDTCGEAVVHYPGV